MCYWWRTCPVVWAMLWRESCRGSDKKKCHFGTRSWIEEEEEEESKNHQRAEDKERNQEHHVVLYCSDCRVTANRRLIVHQRIYTWPILLYEVFSLLPLKALLREPARCVLAFHLLRATWETPVWPVNRFLCIPANGASVSPVCNSAEPSVAHVTLR